MVEKRKTKAGTGGCKHKSTEEPNGHDHRPRWFVRGDECWSVVIVDGVVERGSGDGKKAKSCVGKEKTVCHFGSRRHLGAVLRFYGENSVVCGSSGEDGIS